MTTNHTEYTIETFDTGPNYYYIVYALVGHLRLAVLMTLDFDEATHFIEVQEEMHKRFIKRGQ